MFDKNYTTFVPDRDDWKYNRVILNDDVVCFTDGSRIEQLGLAWDGWRGIRSSPYTSVFQVYALLTCGRLDSLLLRNDYSIAICSDSLAAIKAVSAHKATTTTIILASLPSLCQKLSQLVEVLTKTILTVFLRHGVHSIELIKAIILSGKFIQYYYYY